MTYHGMYTRLARIHELFFDTLIAHRRIGKTDNLPLKSTHAIHSIGSAAIPPASFRR